jgi:hypothetical protein
MGARRRLRQTARKPVGREVLDRLAVKDPVTYPEYRDQKRREAARRRERNDR